MQMPSATMVYRTELRTGDELPTMAIQRAAPAAVEVTQRDKILLEIDSIVRSTCPYDRASNTYDIARMSQEGRTRYRAAKARLHKHRGES